MIAQQGQKRKRVEDELETLRKKKMILSDVCQSLSDEADKLAEDAENKSGIRMTELLTKSNAMRKRMKEKRTDLNDIECQVKEKIEVLKLLPY